MASKWVEEIKARMKKSPPRFNPHTAGILCNECAGGKGKRVPLFAITNYGKEFSVCDRCKKDYVHG